MSEELWLRWLRVVGIVIAGVVGAHWLTYLVAPHGPEHAAREAAHGYWPMAVAAAVLLGLGAATAVAVHTFRRAVRGRPIATRSPVRTAAGIFPFQVALFVSVEVGERLLTGLPLSDLLTHHILVLGIALQLLVAFVIVVALGWLAQGVHAAVRTKLRPVGASTKTQRPGASLARSRAPRLLSGAFGLRGPPPLLRGFSLTPR